MNAFVNTVPAALRPSTKLAGACARKTSSKVTMMAEKSPSVPFLELQKNLDPTLPGYAGFDPLGLSNTLPIKYLAEAELKNGRVAMLAVVGIIVQEFVHLPGPMFSNKLATEAFGQVPVGGLWQIFIACGIAEFIGHKGKMSSADMFEDPNRMVGDMGFDPLGLGKNPSALAKYRENEVKNGRLAMCAVGGFIHQMFITKQPVIEQITHFKAVPY
mmetsp:Transcript_16288/g.40137  ORF Transcript_16288/g.40137 Transcript_16288/m.40137 type:complete len:215 (+) Transcript_16288:213-857(+)|eukprot:CAMPEP_0198332650 /NCGR_PEP_ID=MMETSP1450-20131203/18414_1 /TAXON_ID=753684 ORGANISM="Madagascaria erythrocladiodes, Strain CCMP3234" /NCGR_SAMPLE_ID=MMETSP1450 /ASSEMBLY_ACC=CAM_ASM_001115 /LENGTH=214 /DNA_ID=CAMNT_0044037113 /DNA_START=179 /DNA_END=823 /DNA_ORIENTATION=-